MVFEFFAVPNLTPRLGIKTSQRVGAAILVPLYALLPTLSSVKGYESAVAIAATIFLFTGYVCSHAVSTAGRYTANPKTTTGVRVRLTPARMVLLLYPCKSSGYV